MGWAFGRLRFEVVIRGWTRDEGRWMVDDGRWMMDDG
jgi:hypothetical protein